MRKWLSGLKSSVGDDDANKRILEEFTGVPRSDWLYTQFKSDGLLCPGHCIGIDRRVGAIVFTIRGTMSLSDTLTDLSAVPGALMVHSCSIKFSLSGALGVLDLFLFYSHNMFVCQDGYGHMGIVETARTLFNKHRALLAATLQSTPELKKIIVTGHSLGAGSACVLSLLLHQDRTLL